MPKAISWATRVTKSAWVAVLAMISPVFSRSSTWHTGAWLTGWDGEACAAPPQSAGFELLVLRRCCLLHVFLHSLLVLGDHVTDFGSLVGGKQLVNLRSDLGVLDLHLDVSLRFLGGDGCGFGLIEIATGDELDQLLMGLHFLLHERLEIGFFGLENLLDLGVLVLGEIQFMQHVHGKSKTWTTHTAFVHSMMHRRTFTLGESNARNQRRYCQNPKQCNLHNFGFHFFLLNSCC